MSSSFKIKNRKKSPTDTRITLDAQHNEKMKYFNDLKKSLPSRKKNLKNLQNEFNQLKEKKFNTLTDIELNRYLELKENIPTYQKDIEEIESNKQETDYLLDTGYLLCQYYDNIDNVACGKKMKKKKKKRKIQNKNLLLIFFNIKIFLIMLLIKKIQIVIQIKIQAMKIKYQNKNLFLGEKF